MSVLRVFQNVIAISANRNLKITGMAIAKSLERLSSGLRINRAADDAAGLAISEKLRAQIRGLNRASANALDGISLIQTAEGALNEVHSILQRMRELAVQAANDVYTAGDRQAIQLEVSQLVNEINRISKTTEFNTKTLLDGTLGALVSTDDYTKIRAAVSGNVGKGGNFVLKAVAKTTGQLQIQKSDVFTTAQNRDAVGRINYLQTFRADATITTAGVDGIGNTGVYQVEAPNDANGSIAVNSTVDGRLRISAASFAGAALSIGRSLEAEELTNGDKFMLTANTPNGVTTVSVTISVGTTFTSLAAMFASALSPYVSVAAFDPVTGTFSLGFSTAGVTVLNTKFVDVDGNGGDFYLSFTAGGVSNRFFSNAQVSFYNNGTAMAASLARAAGNNGQRFSIGSAATGAVNVRFETRFDWVTVVSTAGSASDSIKWGKYTGANSLQRYGKTWQAGGTATNDTFLMSAITARTYAVFQFDNQKYTSMVAGGTDQTIALMAARGTRFSNSQGSQTWSIGVVGYGSAGSSLETVRVAFDGILTAGETATFNLSTSNVLTGDQLNTLASLNRFQQFGVFNGRNNVELTIYQRGTDRSVTINLSKNDTFEDMAGKISLALWNPDSTGVIASGILNPQLLPDLVHVNTIGNAKGTISIVTPVPGADIVFNSDEALLKALSLVEVRKSESPIYSINAFNLELNQSVGTVTVDSNEINGLLPGLRIFFDNTLGLRLDPQPPVDVLGGTNTMNDFAYPLPIERPVISLAGTVETFFIHVAPRDFTLQIGANQGQTISSFISDMSAEALGIEGVLVVDSPLAQRAISILDVAINRVSEQRSRLGAIQNRMESTIRNLDVAAENLTASESRIRDVDVAMETMYSTRNQILLQAGIAALAQANALPQAVLQLLR
jgi:flagellin